MRRLAFALVLFAAAACGGEDDPPGPDPDATAFDSGISPDAPPDSAVNACSDTPPAKCEESHASADDCPSIAEVCDGVCGASYECCYCGDDGEWQVVFTDCEPCPQDAGP